MNPDQQNQHLAPPVVGQDVVATPPPLAQAAPAQPQPLPPRQPPPVAVAKVRRERRAPILATTLAIIISLSLATLAYLAYRG